MPRRPSSRCTMPSPSRPFLCHTDAPAEAAGVWLIPPVSEGQAGTAGASSGREMQSLPSHPAPAKPGSTHESARIWVARGLQKGIRSDSRRLSRRALEPPLTQAGLPDARSTPESRRCAQPEAVRSHGAGDTVMSTLEESSAGVAFKEPKTAHGARTIALPEITVEALREHRKAQCEMRLRVGPASRVTTS